jgi:hypothetical protein
MPRTKTQPVPPGWDDSPKGCWSYHPQSRALCQLPQNGHKVHKRKHPNRAELECWRDAPPATKPILRWALWCKQFGFHSPLPHKTELLYESKRAAIAGRLSGSHYNYHPVKVELRRV